MADNFNISDTPPTASAGPASVEFNYDFDTDTTIADPGSKKFRYDNATPAGVTKIAISEIANSGVNTSTLLNSFIAGDHIYIEQTDQAGNNQLYRITSIIDNASWHQLNVIAISVAALPGNTKNCGITLLYSAAASTASCQARRTTDFLLATSFANITFDVTDVELNSAIINHDLGVNDDRIIFLVAGTYQVEYHFDAEPPAGGGDVADIQSRVRLNDAGVALPGSVGVTTTFNDSSIDGDNLFQQVGLTFFVTVAANDFITLQANKTHPTGVSATNLTVPDTACRSLCHRRTWDLPVPAQGASVHARGL